MNRCLECANSALGLSRRNDAARTRSGRSALLEHVQRDGEHLPRHKADRRADDPHRGKQEIRRQERERGGDRRDVEDRTNPLPHSEVRRVDGSEENHGTCEHHEKQAVECVRVSRSEQAEDRKPQDERADHRGTEDRDRVP